MKQLKLFAVAMAVATAGALAVTVATAQSRIDRTETRPPRGKDCLKEFDKNYLRAASKAYDCRSEIKPVCRNGTVLQSVKVEKNGNKYEIVYICEEPSRE